MRENDFLRLALDNATIRSMSKQLVNKLPGKSSLPVTVRVVLAVALPVILALAAGALISSRVGDRDMQEQVPLLAVLGLVSWFMGMAWYGLPGMGLRGKRPLFAGIGFAVLAWIPFLLLRFYFVSMVAFGRGTFAGQAFFYLLLFEALAVQLWAFGLVFRTLAEWRGGLTAAIGSGILFGMVAFTFFEEGYVDSLNSLVYFVLWGVLYGIIRLRTGSILGIVPVQAIHSFTAWVVLLPQGQPNIGQLQSLYLAASVAYLIVAWRLWPREEDDYRV